MATRECDGVAPRRRTRRRSRQHSRARTLRCRRAINGARERSRVSASCAQAVVRPGRAFRGRVPSRSARACKQRAARNGQFGPATRERISGRRTPLSAARNSSRDDAATGRRVVPGVRATARTGWPCPREAKAPKFPRLVRGRAWHRHGAGHGAVEASRAARAYTGSTAIAGVQQRMATMQFHALAAPEIGLRAASARRDDLARGYGARQRASRQARPARQARRSRSYERAPRGRGRRGAASNAPRKAGRGAVAVVRWQHSVSRTHATCGSRLEDSTCARQQGTRGGRDAREGLEAARARRW